MANKPLKSITFPGLTDTYTFAQIDNTLAVAGKAADSKAVGDEIADVKADFNQISEPYGTRDVSVAVDTSDVRNGFPSNTVGNTINVTSSSKTKTIANAFSVVGGTTYHFTITNGSSITLTNSRNIVFTDTSETVVEYVSYSNGSTPNGSVTVSYTPTTDGYVWIAVDYTFASVTAKTIENTYTAIDALARDKVNVISPEYEILNYMLFVDVLEHYTYTNGELVATTSSINATSKTRVDKTKNIYSSNAYTGHAVFFDADENYISSLPMYVGTPVLASDIPNNAVYVAFDYNTSIFVSNAMYMSTDSFIHSNDADRIKRMAYSATKKAIGTRPVINIYTSDTEEEILFKLLDAYMTRDCDVYFENGTYTFSTIWSEMYETYSVRNYFELPIGGNCRYYLNGSTIKGDPGTFYDDYTGTICLFSNLRMDNEPYEIYDGYLEGTGITYIVHDQGSDTTDYYAMHMIKNVKFSYASGSSTVALRKCVGGGTSRYGLSAFENCIFETDYTYDVSYHGINSDNVAKYSMSFINCYFSKCLSLDSVGTNQVSGVIYTGCSATATPSTGVWNVTSWNNEVRT